MASGLSDIGTKVYIWSVSAYTTFVSVSKIGAVGGSMDKHESTCLDDLEKTYVAGRLDNAEIEFTYNYTKTTAQTVKGKMDGATLQKLMIVYPDKSGYEIEGVGTDRTDDLSANSLISGSFTFVVSSKTFSADLTAKIPA